MKFDLALVFDENAHVRAIYHSANLFELVELVDVEINF